MKILYIAISTIMVCIIIILYIILSLRQPYVGTKYIGDIIPNAYPIDAVITWVDSSNIEWQSQKEYYISKDGDDSTIRFPDVKYPDLELETCVDLIIMNAPFIRTIFIVVSDGQYPKSLKKDKFRLKSNIVIINHSQIFKDNTALPTFNSHAIEANLHRIPNLAEHFIYFNDDMFLTSKSKAERWFIGEKISVQNMSRYRPYGSKLWFKVWIRMMKMYFPINIPWHGAKSLTKTSMREAEKSISDEWTKTIFTKFRSKYDIAPIGFTLNYALKNGLAYRTNDEMKLLAFHKPNKVWNKNIKGYDIVCINETSDVKKSIDNFKMRLFFTE